MRPRRPWRLIPAITLVLGGCHTAMLDMRAIEEPVMLNALPFPGADFEAQEVGDYHGQVGDASGAAATGVNQSTAKTMLDNDAQAKAFELVGGHVDRAIGGVEISASGGGANLLIAFIGTADVSATGKAFEIRGDEPSEAPAEDAATSESEAPADDVGAEQRAPEGPR